MSHKCHAKGCNLEVAPSMLMCLKHWRMVPKQVQAWVWDTYRPGQELDKQPTSEYMQAQQAAIKAVAIREKSEALSC